MLQAEHYKKVLNYELNHIGCPRPVWEREYGKADTCRRTGKRHSKYRYLGFEDGSRLRLERLAGDGGTVLPPN